MPSRLTTVAVASAAGISALSATFVAVPALAASARGESPKEAVTDRVSAIRDRLQGLVDDKTLTDAQADKVAEALGERGGPPGRDGRPHLRRFGGPALAPAATYLGMSEADVRAALRDGTTLAELAEQKGKTVDGLVAAITKTVTERIDKARTDGKITQDQTDRAKARVTDGVERFVREGLPERGHRKHLGGPGFGFRGFGHGPEDPSPVPGEPGTDESAPEPPAPAPSTSASSSTFRT